MAASNILASLAVRISAIDDKFGASLEQNRKQLQSFSNTAKNLSSVINALGVGFSAVAIVNGLKSAIGVISNFEASMSEVKAITGATGKEFQGLTNDALRLGSSTKFTATEVSKLQVAYGRLGFTTKEILAATEATLALAAATGEDLAKSADVAGSTVRGFGLDASETQRVVDVMASSFNKTALGLENFTESMKYVAPIANAANVSVEETTALLGVLADSGIRGSQAGTALRKIFGDLSKDGRPVQERLAELGKRGVSLADSFDEVGRTAQTALLVLTKNTDKTNELTHAFRNANGEAAQMSRIMQDNLTGDVTKLTSAFEGLLLTIGKTDSLRGMTQALTKILNLLQGNENIDSIFNALTESIRSNTSTFDQYKQQLIDIRKETGRAFDVGIVAELAEDFKLTDEQAGRLRATIDEINSNLSFQEQAIKQFNEFASRNGYTDLSKAADDYKQSLYNLILAQQIQKSGLEKVNIDGTFNDDIKNIDGAIAAYRKIIDIINEVKTTSESAAAPFVETKGIVESLEERIKLTEQAIKKAFTVPQIKTLQKDLEKLQEELAQILAPNVANRGENKLDLQGLTKIGDAFEPVKLKPIDSSAFNESLEALQNNVRGAAQQIEQEFIDIGGMIANSISGIADDIGTALGSGDFKNLGKALLSAVASFAQQLGAIMISIGVGRQLLSSGNPVAMIAGGAVLVAAGAALKAVLGKQKDLSGIPLGSSGGGGRSSFGGSSGSNFVGTSGMEIKVGGEFRIQGQDLVYILNRQEQLNGRTG